MIDIKKEIEDYLDGIVRDISDDNPELIKDIKEEFRSHLLTLIEQYKQEGVGEELAFHRAVQDFGNSTFISRQLSIKLKRKSWMAQQIVKYAFFIIIIALLIKYSVRESPIPYFNIILAILVIFPKIFSTIYPSLSVVTNGLRLKLPFHKTAIISIDKIKAVRFESYHLFGIRNLIIDTIDNRQYRFRANIWGAKPSIRYISSKKKGVVSDEVLNYINKIKLIRYRKHRWISVTISIFLLILAILIAQSMYRYWFIGSLPLILFANLLLLPVFAIAFISTIELNKRWLILILFLLIGIHNYPIALIIFSSDNYYVILYEGYSVILLIISALIIYLTKISKQQILILVTSTLVVLLGWQFFWNKHININQDRYETLSSDEADGCLSCISSLKGSSIVFECYKNSVYQSGENRRTIGIVNKIDNKYRLDITKISEEFMLRYITPVNAEDEFAVFLSKKLDRGNPKSLEEFYSTPEYHYYYTELDLKSTLYKLNNIEQFPEYDWIFFYNTSVSKDKRYILASKTNYEKIQKSDNIIYDRITKSILPLEKKYGNKYIRHIKCRFIDENKFWVCFRLSSEDKDSNNDFEYKYVKYQIENNKLKQLKVIDSLNLKTCDLLDHPFAIETDEDNNIIIRNLESNKDYILKEKFYIPPFESKYILIPNDYITFLKQDDNFLIAYPILEKNKQHYSMYYYDSKSDKSKIIKLPKANMIKLPQFSSDGNWISFLMINDSFPSILKSVAIGLINIKDNKSEIIYRYGCIDSIFKSFFISSNMKPVVWAADGEYQAFIITTLKKFRRTSQSIVVWKVPQYNANQLKN